MRSSWEWPFLLHLPLTEGGDSYSFSGTEINIFWFCVTLPCQVPFISTSLCWFIFQESKQHPNLNRREGGEIKSPVSGTIPRQKKKKKKEINQYQSRDQHGILKQKEKERKMLGNGRALNRCVVGIMPYIGIPGKAVSPGLESSLPQGPWEGALLVKNALSNSLVQHVQHNDQKHDLCHLDLLQNVSLSFGKGFTESTN